MLLDIFFIIVRSENKALNDCILEVGISIVQILLFVDYISKEEIAISTKAIGLFLVHERLDVREALVEIACATFAIALSLIN